MREGKRERVGKAGGKEGGREEKAGRGKGGKKKEGKEGRKAILMDGGRVGGREGVVERNPDCVFLYRSQDLTEVLGKLRHLLRLSDM